MAAAAPKAAEASNALPPNREKNLNRRPGFEYMILRLDFEKGSKFGLGIKHYQNKVFVSRVDDGSLSAKTLKMGDRIVDINGDPVSDKDVARTLLVKSLAKSKTASLLVERPVSDAAKSEMNAAMNASQMQPPSIAHPSDVREIVQKQLGKPIAQKPPKPALKKPGSGSGGAKKRGGVKINEKSREIPIRDDNEGKQLQHVQNDNDKQPKSKEEKSREEESSTAGPKK